MKYLICGNLFVLVRLVNFNCFTLRCFQVTFFNQFYFFLHFSPNIFRNYNLVQMLCFCKFVPFLLEKTVKFFNSFKKTVQIFNYKKVPNFTNLHFSPFFFRFSPRPRKQFQVHVAHSNWFTVHMAAYK